MVNLRLLHPALPVGVIKKLLSYLPSNNSESPPVLKTDDDPERIDKKLKEIVPADFKKSYDMHEVIERVVDQGSFFEILRRYALNIIVGFARMDRHTIKLPRPSHCAFTSRVVFVLVIRLISFNLYTFAPFNAK